LTRCFLTLARSIAAGREGGPSFAEARELLTSVDEGEVT
jgi:hypothetical protein